MFWKPHGKNALSWAFHGINDNTQVDGKVPQLTHCMICHNVPFTTRTKFKKRVISYFKTNEITISKKHVDSKHILLAKN